MSFRKISDRFFCAMVSRDRNLSFRAFEKIFGKNIIKLARKI